MTAMCPPMGTTAAQATDEIRISAFDFATQTAARAAWQRGSGAPAVQLYAGIEGVESPGVRFPCSFTSSVDRNYWDRNISLDLSVPSVISLRIYIEDVGPIGALTLFFRSGGASYAKDVPALQNGWQTARLNKSSFVIEGTPSGWGQIDGIRFSPWKARDGATAIIANELKAYTPDITIIEGTRNPESGSAVQFANSMASLLDSAGLEYSFITDETAEQTAIPGRLAILPYNAGLQNAELTHLEQFVADGGKIIALYTSESRVTALLGVAITSWQQIQMGAMQFEPGLVECAPSRTLQASWNFYAARAVSAQTQVLAWWEDAQGKRLTYPAWLLSPNGAYMSHVLLDDDLEKKRLLMLSLAAHFLPDLKSDAAARAVAGIGKIGVWEHFDEARAGILEQGRLSPRLATARRHIASAEQLQAAAEASLTSGTFCETLDLAAQSHAQLLEAYYLAQTPIVPEFRAVWCHSGTGPWPGDWERAADNLATNGFNAIFPNMLWGGLAHYNSACLPHSDDYNQYGDQIAACIAACRPRGIQVHVWKVNWNLLTASANFISQMRAASRTQVDANGNPIDWLCPSNPLNQQLELDSLLEVATNYDVDGIHFDYIRYPDETCCYCDGCRARFQADTGLTATNWPQDCYSGSLKSAYRDWRAAQIAKLVRSVSEAVRAVRPNVKISAAVFPNYPSCRTSIGQDWISWAQNGYLDFLCPMDYTESMNYFQGMIETQSGYVAGAVPLYPGVGYTAISTGRMTPDLGLEQLRITRQLKTGGFVIFNYDVGLSEDFLPNLRKGFTAPPGWPAALGVY